MQRVFEKSNFRSEVTSEDTDRNKFNILKL